VSAGWLVVIVVAGIGLIAWCAHLLKSPVD
jgi:hypothetical protein